MEQDVLQRQQIVQHAEDRLLDLARVARAADEHQPPREVQRDDDVGRGPVPGGIGLEARGIDDRERRLTARRRVNPAPSTRNRLRANRLCQAYSVTTRIGRRYCGVGAAVTLLNEQLAAGERRDQVVVEQRRNAEAPSARLTGPQAIAPLARSVRGRGTCRSASVPCAVRSDRRAVRLRQSALRRDARPLRTSAGADRFQNTRAAAIPSASRVSRRTRRAMVMQRS